MVTDCVVDGKMPDSFSPAVTGDTVRYTCNLQLQIKGVAVVKDVHGAYRHGTPRDPRHPNRRALYARVAPGLKEFGYPRWVDGVEYVLKIVGNVPGRQDAGVVWGEAYTKFLTKECGFSQSAVDRRLYFKKGPAGQLVLLCVYVDDNRIVANDKAALKEFEAAFNKRFPDSLADLQADVSSDFVGVKYEETTAGTIELSCQRLLSDLRRKLEALPEDWRLEAGAESDTPMAEGALEKLRESQPGGKEAETLLCGERVKQAQEIAGLAGWIATSCRPDAYFAYVVLSQYLAFGLTKTVWRALLSWATYLGKPEVGLTYHACPEDSDLEVFADSALFNAGSGASYGGYAARFPGSGVFAWKSFAPRKLGTSSGAAETTMAAHAVHYVIGQRIMSRELGMGKGRATVLHTDNMATLQGTAMENLPAAQRYMAVRRAVIRRAHEAGVVELRHVGTDNNIAGMFTKVLPRERFLRLRDLALGRATEPDAEGR